MRHRELVFMEVQCENAYFYSEKNNNNQFPTLSFNRCNNFCDLKASDYLRINCDIQNESTSSI